MTENEIDPSFIQNLEQRPKFNPIPQLEEQIPIIDLSASSPSEIQHLVSEIGDACRIYGFFQVINHGVPSELRRETEKVAKALFDLPIEEKRKVKRNEVDPMGYYEGEHTKNVRDWKEVFDYLVIDPTLIPASDDPNDQELRSLTNQWPQFPSQFREICEEYTKQVEKLAFKLLELISQSLGLPADHFNGYFKDQISFSRINHYPPCPAPHLALGVGRHKDGGALTVLAQDDVGGLQIALRSNGDWIPVNPIPNAFIINIGNCLQVWTNDEYWSAEHRVVVNSEKERFSMPFFFFPSHYVQIKPLDELIDDQNPPKYKEFNWGKFFASRNRSDFKKQNEDNVQIDHFKAS
ncbi:protein DOWNY MILDEW RESISTANCE 6-like [Mercurialis annua]|uniref:protein DOWNY MILDEW RESISTANCE 6-like n=1 Tax=Mercurialis annua TaxID=3986 RepID=UPI00215FFC6F|nr:protein DOWNY MILDEW RESISTANCE 6-like [Mercurialis annua]